MSSRRITIQEKYPNISASELRIIALEAEVLRLRDKLLETNYNMERIFKRINDDSIPIKPPAYVAQVN